MKTVNRTDEFNSWLSGLKDPVAAARIAAAVDRLAFGLGDVQPIGDGVSELRMHFGPGYRAYFVTRQRTLIVMLCGGDKGSQKRDLKEAKSMAKKLE